MGDVASPKSGICDTPGSKHEKDKIVKACVTTLIESKTKKITTF